MNDKDDKHEVTWPWETGIMIQYTIWKTEIEYQCWLPYTWSVWKLESLYTGRYQALTYGGDVLTTTPYRCICYPPTWWTGYYTPGMQVCKYDWLLCVCRWGSEPGAPELGLHRHRLILSWGQVHPRTHGLSQSGNVLKGLSYQVDFENVYENWKFCKFLSKFLKSTSL